MTYFEIMGDFYFFFGPSALQNYMSELFGIAVTILVIDQVIKYRDKKRDLPLKQMTNSLLYDAMDKFLDAFTPIDQVDINASPYTVYFGKHSTFITQKMKRGDAYSLNDSIRTQQENYIFWIKKAGDNKKLQDDNIELVNDGLKKVIDYKERLDEILLYHGNHLDTEVIITVHAIRLRVKKHFDLYVKQIQTAPDADRVALSMLIPNVMEDTLKIWDQLSKQKTHARDLKV